MTQRRGLSLKWTSLIVLVILLVITATTEISGNPTINPTAGPAEAGLAAPTQRTQRTPGGSGGSPRHRHGHGTNGQQRVSPRTISRPAECCLSDVIFNDCFLCGKVTEDLQTYQNCCQRDSETVHFCGRLLTRRR